MFRNFKRRTEVSSLQQQQEQVTSFLKEHQKQFDQAMESQKKASDLMLQVYKFMVEFGIQSPSTQHEQTKEQLLSCLQAVQEDKELIANPEVQELINEIYRSMNDKESMMKILPRLGILSNTPSTPPDVLSNLHFKF